MLIILNESITVSGLNELFNAFQPKMPIPSEENGLE